MNNPTKLFRISMGKRAIMVTFRNTGARGIKIMFPYDPKTVTDVKTLSGRRYHNDGPANKYWTCPLLRENVEKLAFFGFSLDQELREFLENVPKPVDELDASDLQIPGLGKKLYPYQRQGVMFLETRKGRALIADEMGLGKTAQALAWLQMHPEKRPAVVVVPASLKLNWERETQMWMASPFTQVLNGAKPSCPIIGDIIIINYDILNGWVEALREIKPQALILDECHYIKNNRALRTKAVKKLARGVPHVIALSGTPIVNRPIEAYNALKLVDPTCVPGFMDYARRYCGARHNGFGWDFTGATNTRELHERLTKTVMVRRKKADVLSQLPAKQRSVVPLEIQNRREYDRAEKNFINWVKDTKGDEAAAKAKMAEALAQVEALKQLTINGKMNAAVTWIRDFLDVDGKLVVFCAHKVTIDRLMQEFGEVAVKVDGSVSGQARQAAVDAFQNDDRVRLFVGNMKAAGVGITLTAASSVAFLELGWTPGDHDQAEDRIHRIGQEANSVNAYYLIAQGTIEDEIIQLIDRKRRVLDRVLDGQETDESSLLSELLTAYDK